MGPAPGRRAAVGGPAKLAPLALGALSAQALFAANELGVFGLLADAGPLPAAEVAARLGTAPDATARLLGTLVAIGLLERDGDRFANAPTAAAHLVPGAPGSMASWVSLVGGSAETFRGLGEAVRTGESTEPPREYVVGDPDERRRFCMGMHEYAIGSGRELARDLDLSGRARLLDVGGGPGTYAVLLAECNPDLSCVVFDLPSVVEVADEVIARHGLGDRVSTLAGTTTATRCRRASTWHSSRTSCTRRAGTPACESSSGCVPR
jgi:hypothetical protein